MKTHCRTLFCLLAAALLACFACTAAFAADKSASGSIAVRLDRPDPVSGAEFILHRVAEVNVAGSGFVLTPDFKGSGIRLDDLSAPGLADHLTAWAQEQSLRGNLQPTDANGVAFFDGLTPGLYLIYQNNRPNGNYPVLPFLVSLPTRMPDGSLAYEVTARPKQQPAEGGRTSLSVRKLWAAGSTPTDSIHVTLLRDGKVYDSCLLHKDNDWQHTWSDLDAAFRWSAVESKVPGDYTVSYQIQGSSVTVTNTPDHPARPTPRPTDVPKKNDMIQTGQLNWPVPVLAVSGMLLFAMGWTMSNSGGRHDQD